MALASARVPGRGSTRRLARSVERRLGLRGGWREGGGEGGGVGGGDDDGFANELGGSRIARIGVVGVGNQNGRLTVGNGRLQAQQVTPRGEVVNVIGFNQVAVLLIYKGSERDEVQLTVGEMSKL